MQGGTDNKYWMVHWLLTILTIAATLQCILTCGTGQKQRTDTDGASICCFTAKCNTSQRFRFCQNDQGYDICQDCPPDQYTNDPIDTSQWNEETDVCVLKPDCSAPEKILVGNECECDRSKGYFGTDPDNCGIKVDDCKIAGYQLNNDGNCIECGPNQFKPGIDQFGICQDKRKCKEGEIEENPGNTTTDRICKKQEELTTVIPQIITTTEATNTTVNKESDKTWIIVGVLIAVLAILVFVVIGLWWKRNTLRETFKDFNICNIFSARCKKCKKGDRPDLEENRPMLPANGSAGNGHVIGSQGNSIPSSTFQEEQDSSLNNQVSNGNIVLPRNGTRSLQSDTMMNEHDGRQNSHHIDSSSEQASGLTMNTFINGSEAASICENRIETRDRTKMSHSDSNTYNTLNANSLLQNDNSLGEQALNPESVFVHSSPQTSSPVPCDREPDTIPKTMSDDFSIESVKEQGEESLPKNNSNGNIPQALFQSLQTVPNRLNDLNEIINQQSEVPQLPVANQPNVPDLSARNPPIAIKILKPQTRVRPTAKVMPTRSTSQDQHTNTQASNSGNAAEGFTPSPTTEYGNDIQQAVNNENHKVVANTPYGEYPDMRENDNTEDDATSAQSPPPNIDGLGELRQQPSLTTTHESQQTEEMNHEENNEHQPNLHQTASGNVLATVSSDNSRESESNQSSLQQETVNQVPDTYSYP